MGFSVRDDNYPNYRRKVELTPEQIIFCQQLINQSQQQTSETKERINALIEIGMIEAINSLKDIATSAKSDELKICASAILLNLYQSHKCD